MVGGENHKRIVGEARLIEGGEHPTDCLIHLCDVLVEIGVVHPHFGCVR